MQLAHEDRERRHAGERQRREHEERRADRRHGEQAPDDPHVARAVAGDGRAGDEEREGLGDAVVHHVQQRAVGPDGAAEAEPERDDPDVLDAVVAEQALEVVLDQDERRRHDDRDEAEDEQHLRRERRAARGGGDGLEADDPEERALDEDAREQRRDRRGRLAVGVGQPEVHGRETGLGAVADHHEDEADADDARVEPGRDLHDRRPAHRARASRDVRRRRRRRAPCRTGRRRCRWS